MADPKCHGKRPPCEDGHSSGSDEDHSPVEVVFEDANPYRRKSSLVTSDAVLPHHLRREPPPPQRKTECLVHQFLADHLILESHNVQPDRHTGASTSEPEDILPDAGPSQAPEQAGPAPPIPRRASSSPGNGDAHTPGESESEIASEAESDANQASSTRRGQVDEKHWRHAITHRPATTTTADADTITTDITTTATSTTATSTLLGALPPSATNSRLLTKRQLSEMAWGVRELSRRLGTMRLRFRVRNIFVLTKIYDAELIAKTRELCAWLLSPTREVRYTVYVDRELRGNGTFDAEGLVKGLEEEFEERGFRKEKEGVGKRLRFWGEGVCAATPHAFDFVITLGGDGTVLYASWLFQRIVPPVLSFALGSLGFLTKFDFEEYQKTLSTAFNEGVTVSLRLRFEATVMRSQKRKELEGEGQQPPARDLVEELIGEEKDDEHTHRPEGTYEVLNEVVVDRGPNPTMSNIEIFGDDEHFTSVSADGLCVSTPTGSTAYNLAAGGSLCHPENPVMLVTAICAHTLSFRPIVLPDTIVLRMGVPYDARASSWASFDGRERVELCPGDYVTVSASRYPFACVQPHGRRSEHWINSINAKLGWNTRQRQKALKKWEK
ncbi:hypothetical protein C8A05DRAFT_12857 [Staphylotrichum tortipilum]|uniref:NAD+ kinase n=1 Tax=Staphylotrichum tortipilum TaxID=2831512 RepID=A0AAN6MRX5_9PEZI|nr:hypothetical protein C8A05DRAFT_12857 [Staphylotrichum longicolle]